MGQIRLTISLVMIGLFTIAIIGFAINFASDNDSAFSIADDPELSELYSDTQSNISGFSDDSADSYKSILNTTIKPASDSPQSAAPFAITPVSAVAVSNNIMKVGYSKIFGSGTGFGIFLTTLIGIIVFMIGLYIYKTLRGNPD